MKLTLFGEAVRHLRMRYDLSLKEMAQAIGISSAYLSAIEYGEKKLSEKLSSDAIAYLSTKANPDEVTKVADAAEKSRDVVNTKQLNPDAKGLVAAFARRLQEGDAPSPEMLEWINNRK
ncbi:hypothetical protein GCM10010096_03520 [Alcaligenes pakistanensis]|uniref:HTH cro/C1-type domain-containing protein n=1 Tax=Alcaligenes pakistanensis TaxID=1482717 RepID=A0A8H9IF35_9BURK|nr:helix-turn-helix transcriptional regulator [Alcaligenes pakistanensis]GHC37345.1 hypothetical protein GCM10010096_03520 [Alcaligenes pakistanensis]